MISQVLQRGVEEAGQGGAPGQEPRLPDCKAAVFGLTQLLRDALHRPGPLAGQVFSVLEQLLRQLYAGSCFTATSCVMRINVSRRLASAAPLVVLFPLSLQIFNCLLSMRANEAGQLGFQDSDSQEIRYSPFHVCTPGGGQRSMAFSPTILQFGGVFEAVLACLSQDVEREAVFQLLHLLRAILQCRTLTLAAMPDLSPLLPPLCSLAEGHGPRLDLFHSRPSPVEVGSSVYPILAVLGTYPGHLDRRAQVSEAPHWPIVCSHSLSLPAARPGVQSGGRAGGQGSWHLHSCPHYMLSGAAGNHGQVGGAGGRG